MRKKAVFLPTFFIFTVSLVGSVGCDGLTLSANADNNENGAPDENGNQHQNDNGDADTDLLEIVDTGLDVHIYSLLRGSHRFIAYRSDASGEFVSKVYDIQTNTEMDIPEPADEGFSYFYNDFAVAGSWVILAGEDQHVYAFDALNPDAGTKRVGEISLPDYFGAPSQQGYSEGVVHSDGGNIVAFLASDFSAAWIDVTDEALSVNAVNTLSGDGSYWHNKSVNGTKIALIESEHGWGEEGSNIVIIDTAAPDADPQVFTSTYISPDYPIIYEGNYILFVFYGTCSDDTLRILDVTSGSVYWTGVVVRGGEGRHHVGSIDIGDEVFCGLNRDGHFGGNYQSFVGEIGSINMTNGSNNYTLVQDESLFPPRATRGWGTSCAVSDDGKYVFVAGSYEPTDSTTDLLSMWIDGFPVVEMGFSGNTVRDIDNTVSASGVVMVDDAVFFRLSNGKAGRANLGYIRLP